MRRLLCAIAFASLAPALFLAGEARACTIDGKASAYANGVRAVIVTTAPTTTTYGWWAHFAFPRAFRPGQAILFHEDDAQVRKALQGILPASYLRRPWRWRFGDGAAVTGDAVSHKYGQPGHYRVSVDAYFPHYGWQAFDSITVTIQR